MSNTVLIFGGTTEGRELCELCDEQGIPARCCVATPEGTQALKHLNSVEVSRRRLDADAMLALLKRDSPSLVVDATHPYAHEVSQNIAQACQKASTTHTPSKILW